MNLDLSDPLAIKICEWGPWDNNSVKEFKLLQKQTYTELQKKNQ